VISSNLFRANLVRLLIALALCVSLSVPPGFCQDTEDSQIFIAGFNAYQQRDFTTTIAKMDEVLKKYPDTTLRDMALFWLARAHFKNGHPQAAARTMSQFSKEYPDSPLRGTVEEELLTLTARHDRGEKLPLTDPGHKESIARAAQAEKERLAAEKAEAARLAQLKLDQERISTEKAEKERAAEAARLAALKAEQERQAALQAEQQRLAQLKAEQERLAAEKVEQERVAEVARLAQLKAEQERIAAVNAEQQRLAAEMARSEKIAAEKAEKARVAEAARLAALKAEQERQVALQAEQERLAQLKAEQERVAAEKAEQERLTAEKAETARLAQLKLDQERSAAEKAKQERLAVEKAEKAQAAKTLLREKAIEQYKTVIQSYPNTKSAATAAAKLRDLGVSVSLPSQPATSAPTGNQAENEQVFRLEVTQFAALELNLPTAPKTFDVAKRLALPFEITNQGNGNDSFDLESGFPAEYASNFVAAAALGEAITRTPPLAPGETFKGFVQLTIPAASIDGLRITHPIKAASLIMGDATQSREIHLVAAAPLLRAIVKTDKTRPLPGEKMSYRIVLLNVGSTVARDVSLRLSFSPQLEPLDQASAGQSTLVVDGIQLKSGESRELPITFRLKDDSLAGQELLCRAELVNNQLKTSATFVSNAASVKAVHGLLVRSLAERIVIIPGQTVSAPFVVTNSGNVREKFAITPEIKGAGDTTVFLDLNRDGVKQAGEPVISEVGPLEPKEEASIVMEIKSSHNTADASEGSARITFSPEGDASRSAFGLSGLIYSRPVLQMAMASGNGRLKPGDVVTLGIQGLGQQQQNIVAAR